MEDVKKDVMHSISNKRESFLSYPFHFHGDIEVKNTNSYCQHLELIYTFETRNR